MYWEPMCPADEAIFVLEGKSEGRPWAKLVATFFGEEAQAHANAFNKKYKEVGQTQRMRVRMYVPAYGGDEA